MFHSAGWTDICWDLFWRMMWNCSVQCSNIIKLLVPWRWVIPILVSHWVQPPCSPPCMACGQQKLLCLKQELEGSQPQTQLRRKGKPDLFTSFWAKICSSLPCIYSGEFDGSDWSRLGLYQWVIQAHRAMLHLSLPLQLHRQVGQANKPFLTKNWHSCRYQKLQCNLL